MERGPTQTPNRSPERVKPLFERASEPNLVRQADIDLKSSRIHTIAASMEGTYAQFAQKRHEGTAYSAEEIKVLERPLPAPPGISQQRRVPGTPKTDIDVNRLARIDARKRVYAQQTRLSKIAEDMKSNGQSVSNGRITQIRRGADAKTQKLDKPLNTHRLRRAFTNPQR